MRKIFIWMCLATLVIMVASYALYDYKVISANVLPVGVLVTALLYTGILHIFWSRLSRNASDSVGQKADGYFFELIHMLVRHRKDKATLRVIMNVVASEGMKGPLARNYKWALETLVKGRGTGYTHLHQVILDFCNLSRGHALDKFRKSVESRENVTGDLSPDQETQKHVYFLNVLAMECFRAAGGFYATWTDVQRALEPIFAKLPKEDLDSILLAAELRYEPTNGPVARELEVEEARKHLFINLRVWNSKRAIAA